ncbi:1,4-alpha-glucan branching enzyme [Streptomyces sp. NPDC054933]
MIPRDPSRPTPGETAFVVPATFLPSSTPANTPAKPGNPAAPGTQPEAAARGYTPGNRPPASGTAPRRPPTAAQPRNPSTATPGTPTAGPGGTEPTAPQRTAPPVDGGKPSTARRPTPPVASPATAPIDPVEVDRLLAGAHHDPHALLGAHPVAGGIAVRALRPYARAVAVVAPGLRVELRSEGRGLFSALLPLREIPDYRLLVTYDDGEHEVHDAYRLLPSLGDLDLHLIHEGRHEQLWQALGARVMTHQGIPGTRFAVWAPNARGVQVVGDFNYWDGAGHPMRSLGSSGVWELFVPEIGEGALYKFRIAAADGGHVLKADPMARRTETPPATASVVEDTHHTWHDQEWLARRGARPVHESPFSVYEVHLPSWRPGLTYRELADQLPSYVRDLGFTHVELMPVAEHPFGGSWGYQVTSYYAPTARLGTPDDFKYLIDALHRAGIGVLMDWVPAHFPKDDWALARFDGTPLYEPDDPLRAEHPDWGTLEFDFGRTEVKNFLVANAVYWLEEFHIDGLRVDAVASMLYLDYSREDGQWSPNAFGGRENLDAVSFLQEMNATVYRRCPGIVTVAEESTAWDGVTRPTDAGGLGFGLKWNMGWMHDTLSYLSHEPVHRKHHHGDMTFAMVYAYSENYVLPISHDEVVHGKRALVAKAPGDWWQRRATHRAYLGFMWAHPGKQLLFMGQEFAQGAEWSHDTGPDWWLTDPGYSAAGDHTGVRDLVRDLNTSYLSTPALWQLDTDPAGFAWIDGHAADDNVLSFVRYDTEGCPLVCVSNFSPVVRHDYKVNLPSGHGDWREVLNTDRAAYGGSGVGNSGAVSAALTLPPLATIWLRPGGIRH